jgi:hypothetical protein
MIKKVICVSNNENRATEKLNGKKIGIILTLALVGWTICGMIMGIGMATTTIENTLILHALLVPVVFFTVSILYFSKFNYTTPLETAGIFIVFVILMDFFVVSIMINKNFDMFKSFLGTWFVFAEIFATTYLTGMYRAARKLSIGSTSPEIQFN